VVDSDLALSSSSDDDDDDDDGDSAGDTGRAGDQVRDSQQQQQQREECVQVPVQLPIHRKVSESGLTSVVRLCCLSSNYIPQVICTSVTVYGDDRQLKLCLRTNLL